MLTSHMAPEIRHVPSIQWYGNKMIDWLPLREGKGSNIFSPMAFGLVSLFTNCTNLQKYYLLHGVTSLHLVCAHQALDRE